MDSVRQQKYGRLIQKELGDLFSREGRNWYGNHFVTVTGVKVSPDLSIARVHVSLFKAPKPAEVIKMLEQHKAEIRNQLGRRIGQQARIIPELHFYIDDTLNYAEKIDDIFRNLIIPPDPDKEAG